VFVKLSRASPRNTRVDRACSVWRPSDGSVIASSSSRQDVTVCIA
jgi:hypothetical protein